MMFGNLRKKLEEFVAQASPFDGGKTASTVRASRQQAPPAQTINRPNQSFANKVFDQVSSNTQADQYRRQQQQRLVQDSTRGTDEAMRNLQKQALTGQVDKNVAAAKIRALGTSNVQPNTAENVLKPDTAIQRAGQKVVDAANSKPVRAISAPSLGAARSIVGTTEGVAGLYDLATPGLGRNRVSKMAQDAGAGVDTVQREGAYNPLAYKAGQAATDVATFAVGGAVAKGVPGVTKGLNYADRLAAPLTNAATRGATSLASKGFVGKVAGKSLQNVVKPRYQAANAGFTALQAGKEASHGKEVTPMGITTNLVAGGVGFPVAGAVVGQTAKPVINAGVNQLRKTNLIRPSKLNPNEVADLARLNDTAKTGAVMDEGVYQRGVQAAQKAGVDYNNPSAVDDLLGKHRNFDTISSQRKQAIDEAKARLANPRPLSNEIGAVGKNVDPLKLTEEQYLARNGAGFMDGAEPALHRQPNKAVIAQKNDVKRTMQSMSDNNARRAELRKEYQDKLSKGEITAPTRNELLIEKANGLPELESTQAAQRLLTKQGVSWKTPDPLESLKQEARPPANAFQDTLPSKSRPASIRELVKRGGNPLYHDTNASGVLGILDSGEIRASQAPFSQIAGQGKRVSTTRNFDNYSRYGKSPYRFVIDETKTGQKAIPDNREEFESIFKNNVKTDSVETLAIDITNPEIINDMNNGRLAEVIAKAKEKGIRVETFEGKILPDEYANKEIQQLTKDRFTKEFGKATQPPKSTPVQSDPLESLKQEARPTVYHGTRNEFDTFKGGFAGGAKTADSSSGGFYFSPMKEVADTYAGTKYGKGRVVEAQLDIKNPKIAKSYQEIGMLTKEDIAKAKAEGYDGYYYKPSKEAIKNGSESPRNEEWVAFDDKQIIRNTQPQPPKSTPTVGKFEKDLQSAGLTGNKAVRPKENTVQTPKNQSQSTPKTEQPVAPQLAETTNQIKAPQTKGRATSSELGQDEKITSGTPKRTVSQSPKAESNIVNPSIRERGFVETIIDDPKTSPKVKENLSSLYSVRNTKQLQTKAANLVKTDPDLAMRVAREDTSDIGVATGSELIKKLQKDGNYEQAIDLATNVAETLTRAGQTSQAASIYGKLTPEGILRFTQKEINAYNKATKKNIKLSPEQAKSLTEKAQKIQEMPEGRPRDIATQEMLKEIYETMPATKVEKWSTAQTMAQLLNPKTLIRNLGGNTIFSVLDNSSQVLATGIDKAISGVRGTSRTTTLPSVKTQAKGLKKGFNEGYEEAVKGINLGPRTQFELNDVPVFRKGLPGKLEKSLNISLRATDRAAYTAAFDDTLKGLMKTNKVTTPTTEMIEMAHHQGLYRTFQDESNAAKIFVGLKRALNIAGFEQNGKRFGLGDLILKYPKTPGNLIARGIDYSPVGILKGMIDLTKIGQGTAKQQSAANSIARGVTGTGSLVGTGYVLAGLGLITEKPEDNKDLRNLQKSAGLGGYQLNTSGLRRFLLSGFDTEEAKLRPGDKLVSYDWAQPAAIPLSMGASMGRGDGVKKGASQSINALTEGVETLAEQPLVRGVQQFFGSNKSAADTLKDTGKGAPASFVPTLSNQVRQLTDNTTRNTSDPNAFKEAYNKAINRVPGVAGQLPAQVDTLGNDKKNFQNGSNNPSNVFLNPSFVNKYQPNNVATTNLDLNRATGETKQLPNTVSNKVKINGQDKVLTGKEQGDYQRFVGQTNSTITDTLTKNPRFNALPDSQKVNLLASMQTDINNAAKVNLFGDNPEKLSESVDSILSGNVERAIELKLKTQEKTVEKKSGKKVAKAKSTKKKSSGKKGGKKGSKGKAKKGKFDYTKNLFASSGTATSGSVSKSLRAILENAQKSSSKK